MRNSGIQDPMNAKEGTDWKSRGLQPLTFKAQGKQVFVTDALSGGRMEWHASFKNSFVYSVLQNCWLIVSGGPRLL